MTNRANTVEVEDTEVTSEDIQKEIADIDLFLGTTFKVEKTGVVKPGIMVTKKDTPPELVKLYTKLVSEGLTWDEIDGKLGVDQRKKSWLTPRNVDFFWIGREDCKIDLRHKDVIKERYADEDGKIRNLGIRFPFDDINKMVTVSLSCYNAGGLLFAGKYHDGKLMCEDMAKKAEELKKATENRSQKVATFKKEKVLNPCDPDSCQRYQNKECTMRGGFIFRIPGVPGIGVWGIYTRSAWNSMAYIRTALQSIEKLAKPYCGLSSIPGGVYYLKKTQQKVRSDGKQQWLITISSDYDEDQIEIILASKFPRTNVVSLAAAAVKRLNGNVIEGGCETTEKGTPLNVANASETVRGAAEKENASAPVEGSKQLDASDGKPGGASSQTVTVKEDAQSAVSAVTKPADKKEKAATAPSQKTATPENTSGDYIPALLTFMRKIATLELLKDIEKIDILRGVNRISQEIMKKPAKQVTQGEVPELIKCIEYRLAKNDLSAFNNVADQKYEHTKGQPEASTQAQGEWPAGTTTATVPKEEIKPSKPTGDQKTAESGPAAADQFASLSPQIAPFLKGIAKNPLFATIKDNVRATFDAYSTRTYGKPMTGLSLEEIKNLINAVSGALAKSDVSDIIGAGKAPSSRAGSREPSVNTAIAE